MSRQRQAFETKLSWDMSHQCSEEFKEKETNSGFERNMVDHEGSRWELRGTEIDSVRLIPLTVLCEITKMGSHCNFLHRTDWEVHYI